MRQGEPSSHELAVRAFLVDHPEHLPGVRWLVKTPGQPEELCLDTAATVDFMQWCIDRGMVSDMDKAKAGLERMKAILAKQRGQG